MIIVSGTGGSNSTSPATGYHVIVDAMAKIGIFAEETAIEPADFELAIRILNDMMTEWDESGTQLGYVPIISESDEVRVSRGALNAVKANLAGRLAPPFKRPISPELAAEIRASGKALARMTVKLGSVTLPGTLPKGSGNQASVYSRRFFPDPDKGNF